jgi:hypothetical protein
LNILGQNVAKFPEQFEENILGALNDEPKYNSFDRYPTSKLFNYFIAKKVAPLTLAQGVVVKCVLFHSSRLPVPSFTHRLFLPACSVVDPGMNHSELPRDRKLPLVARCVLFIPLPSLPLIEITAG